MKENLYEPFEVICKKFDKCPVRDQVFSFFEFVYVLSGHGEQSVNDHTLAYKPGDLYIHTPDDRHSFDVKSTTKFLFIRFNNSYIQDKAIDLGNKQRLAFILQHANHKPKCVLYHESDRLLVNSIAETIIGISVNRNLYSRELMQQLIYTLILLVVRNIAAGLPQEINQNTDEKIIAILHYIQRHIADPMKIRIDELSSHFNISKSYLGRYFKKQTNETIQNYIINYRLKTIENILLYSNMRITEIAFELGFTDESHLDKFFKKRKGVSPTAFRKKQ
ncbi:AraC family transcriptional regulator [Sphingobacterium sp. MYb382]|uniref:AraC family transcriptional regulator n=1 Tax=Sphingobacterium sp. MYb382 TaxID=2745278 RepID=UPI003098C91E